jgi:hypothetical protein
MKTLTALSATSILLMGSSAFAAGDLGSVSRPTSLAELQSPVVHKIIINNDPSLSLSSLAIAPSQTLTRPRAPITTRQLIEFGGRCLWYNEDINVQFGIPIIPGYTMTSANIKLDYSDADFNDVSVWNTPEVDIVGIGDSSFSVDTLKGKNGQAKSAKWSALNQIRNDSASGFLGFQVNIDALHNQMYWCLKVKGATLTTNWR